MLSFQNYWRRLFRRPYSLHVALDVGRGSESVVLLHGIASNGLVWRRLVTALGGKTFRVLAFDLLGFGSSAKPTWSRYSVEDHARSVHYSLKKNSVNFPVTLVGHSMGCLVAVHLAYQHPELVKRVILYEPPLFADIPEFSSHLRRRKLYFMIFERIADKPTMVLTYARLLGRAASKIAGFALSDETWLPFERSLRNTIMSQETYQELHALQIPTEIVYGRFDIVVTKTEVKQMFADNKNITFHYVSDMHGISSQSSRFLMQCITGQKLPRRPSSVAYHSHKRDNKRTTKGGK